MKIYAIGYERIDDTIKFYAYTCKFLTTRKLIDSDLYEEMKKVFNIPSKNNKSISGMYFDTI